MEHYAGIDVSLESASLCVVDATGRIAIRWTHLTAPRGNVGLPP
jgi:predicted NBD/HSP70 family sugar kinase